MSNQNNQKLISKLQSRIARRRKEIAYYWSVIREGLFSYEIAQYDKAIAIDLGKEQKLDKQLLQFIGRANSPYYNR